MTFSWRIFGLMVIMIVLFLIYLQMPKPCQKPITYRLGQIDERFGLARSEFSMAVRKATAIWEKPLSHELFREDPKGTLEINLLYDYRQETSDRLKQLDGSMNITKDNYERIKMRCENMKQEYEQMRATLENDLRNYNSDLNALNSEARSWSLQGGLPEAQRNRLMSRKNELDDTRENLTSRQDEANRLADEINHMVQNMNEIASRQNIDLNNYRDAGSLLGDEFQEGFFESNKGMQSITVYHFENKDKLVRLLAHELGHALRLNHSNNPNAVMYRLNQFDVAELTADDIAALKARCRSK